MDRPGSHTVRNFGCDALRNLTRRTEHDAPTNHFPHATTVENAIAAIEHAPLTRGRA
ncbi:MAG: hypothetical protein K1X88_07610 [Nannocystaceae bacterium]|nr:hypothetical protein [Nannocystaceae bacterium]